MGPSAVPPPNVKTETTRRDLAKLVTALLARWGLDNEQQLLLLGLGPESQQALPAYRAGERALPEQRDVLERVGYLLGIHKCLVFLFPEDEILRYGWVHRRNALLHHRTPLEVMLEDGYSGIARMARFIDQAKL